MPRSRRFLVPAAALLTTVGAAAPLAAQNNVNVPAGGGLSINESGSYQDVSVGSNANLTIVSGNSGGAGNHSIIVTLASGGPGTIQNAGVIDLVGTDQNNTLVLANPVTLSGNGTLQVRNATGSNTASVKGTGTLTQAAGHTLIGGGGNLNNSGPSFSAPLVNHGLVTTNSLGFHLDGASLVNTGVFSAANTTTLFLDAPTLDNTGGTLTVGDADSLIRMDNGITVTGGTLRSPRQAVFNDRTGILVAQQGATLANLTLTADSTLVGPDSFNLAGTINNLGLIAVGGGRDGGVNLKGNVTLTGNGRLLLGSRLNGPADATLTVDVNQTLQGTGDQPFNGFGKDVVNANLTNNGTVEAAYMDFYINSPRFVNNGAVVVNDNCYLEITAAAGFTNFRPTAGGPVPRAEGASPRGVSAGGKLTGGSYSLFDKTHGASLYFTGRTVKTNAASVTLSGPNANFPALDALEVNTGSLALLAQKQHTVAGNLDNEGTVTLDAGSALRVPGDFTAGDDSTLAVTVGGTAASGANSPGVLQVSGNVRLGGTLAVTFAPGAALPGPGDSLPVISATKSVSGAFRNVAVGSRVNSTDGRASFVVTRAPADNVNAGMIVLGNFAQPASVVSVVGAPTRGGFVVSRPAGASAGPLTVLYHNGGSAVQNGDYVPFPFVLGFAAGQSEAVIPVTLLPGANRNHKVKVFLDADPNGAYGIGKAQSKVFLTDLP